MTDAPSPLAHGHGNTPAAWAAVTIIIVASVIGTLGVMLANWPLFWVGVGLTIAGGIVGKVMQMMGLGSPQPVFTER